MSADATTEPFHERLQRLMGKRSKAEIVRASGIQRQSLYDYLDGLSIPRPDAAQRLAEALGVTTAYLLYGEREQESPAPRDLAQLKGWLSGPFFQVVEAVISAEVERRVASAQALFNSSREEWERQLEQASAREEELRRRLVALSAGVIAASERANRGRAAPAPPEVPEIEGDPSRPETSSPPPRNRHMPGESQ